jgi:zinc/manganese transport system substrate-binding protein
MNKRSLITIALLSALLLPAAAGAAIRVAASNNDLASIASSVGGDRVECFAIAKPNSDAHRVEVLPSYMVKVSRAQLYLKVGLGLDQWADQIIDGSRNAHVHVVDCSLGIPVLEKPTGTVNASMGDVHPNGNPHYWLDPRNGVIVARAIAEALAAEDPEHAGEYRAHAEAFAREADESYARVRALADMLPAKVMITYHRSWSYFGNAFGIEIAGEAEPLPGIPPTGRHLAELVERVKARKIPLMLQEPYFSGDTGEFLAREGGLRVVVMSPSCDSPEAGSYLAHFGQVLNALAGGRSGS